VTETGGGQGVVTLVAEADPSALCGPDGGSIVFATRRVECFDPALPCTLPQDPPWLEGTTQSCDSAAGAIRWEVEVGQTGRWHTRLEVGGEVQCFGVGGELLTEVSKADLASRAELLLSPAAGDCSTPP